MVDGLSKAELLEVQAVMKENKSDILQQMNVGFDSIKEHITTQTEKFMPKVECGRKRGEINTEIVLLKNSKKVESNVKDKAWKFTQEILRVAIMVLAFLGISEIKG